MEQKAEKYINSLYIDYGDLNHKAEEQIKQAFIDGMKAQLRIGELLEAFVKQIKEDNEFVDDITFQDINNFLSSNFW